MGRRSCCQHRLMIECHPCLLVLIDYLYLLQCHWYHGMSTINLCSQIITSTWSVPNHRTHPISVAHCTPSPAPSMIGSPEAARCQGRTSADIFIASLCSGCAVMSIGCTVQCVLSMSWGTFAYGMTACEWEAFVHFIGNIQTRSHFLPQPQDSFPVFS